MTAALSHEEIQDLLGAYALDAVDDDERDLVEEHLTTCVRCRAEVADHRETAAMLAFAGQDAPSGLWDRISSSLEEPPPPMPIRIGTARGARERSRARSWWSGGLVAAAAVIISVLALSVSLRDDGGEPRIPDGPRILLASVDGRHSADVVLADGRGYVVNDNLPPLPDDRVYQLWGKRGDDLISLGLLGTDPDSEEFVAGADFEVFAITVERAGGVVSSDQPAVVQGQV